VEAGDLENPVAVGLVEPPALGLGAVEERGAARQRGGERPRPFPLVGVVTLLGCVTAPFPLPNRYKLLHSSG
jgi:hypothetical protein